MMMTIKHMNGKIRIEVDLAEEIDMPKNQSIILTEEQASLLVNKGGQSHLQQCINEAKIYNAQSKRNEIDRLETRLKKLRESL